MTREWYKERKENNLCVRCGKELPKDYDYAHCKKCKEKTKNYYKKRIEKNLCRRCGKKLSEEYEYIHCEKCKEKLKQESEKRRKELKEKNLCVQCGKNKTSENHSLCKKCRLKSNQNFKKFKQEDLNEAIESVPKYMRKYFWKRK